MNNKTIHIENVEGSIYIGEAPKYKVDAAINELLNILASKPFTFSKLKRKPLPETIVKIDHNNIQSRKYIIKQYLDRSSTIESAYIDIAATIPFGKDIIFRTLNDLYHSVLDELDIDYFSDGQIDMEKIRNNSEFILDSIIKKLKSAICEADNAPNLKEHIDAGVNAVVAHAFIECIVLENPIL